MRNKSKLSGFAAIFAVIALSMTALVLLAGCPSPDKDDDDEKPVVVDENTVATPTASPGAGEYASAQSVSLATATEGAAIYYTTDGTAPTVSSALYESPISVGVTTTIKAFAVKEGFTDSAVLTAAYSIVFHFTSAPVLELEPGNAEILYTWTASDPVADTYDVYWKAGDGLTAAAVKDGGTKITGATSGGVITGLTNGTEYCVVVTANKAGYKSIDSAVEGAIPVAIRYAITGSGTTFTAIRDGETEVAKDKPIQEVIGAIQTDANGESLIIEFGDGIVALNIGANSASFKGTGWGFVELSGKITGSVAGNTNTGTITITDDISITSVAEIANTATTGIAVYHNSTGTLHITGGTVENVANNASARAIYNASTGAVNISGGEIIANTGVAVYNANVGKITVSGAAKVSSANVTGASGTIYIATSGTDTDPRLEITGGTVENTASNSGARAVFNASTGTVNISGGSVQATQASTYAVYNGSKGNLNISGGSVSTTTGAAVYNNADGTVNISGGSVSTTTGYGVYNNAGGQVNLSGGTVRVNGNYYAVYNNSTGKITVSGSARISSEFISITGGTIHIADSGTGGERLVIEGGTVENTSSGRAIWNASSGSVNISGGTVSATSNYAVQNNSTGAVNISGGTVQATTSTAVYNASTGSITVSGLAKVTSARVSTTSGTIHIANSGTVTVPRLIIEGGTVENTATDSNARAIYNNSTGEVKISGGTVQATTGVAVWNASTGKITVSGTARVTSANITAANGTIYLAAPATDNTDLRLEINGGTVENTGANGRAIRNDSAGGVTISSGAVKATGSGIPYSVYGNAGATLTITRPPAVIIGFTYPAIFTAPPTLTVVSGSGEITYSWTAPTPAATSYDVYWKAGTWGAVEVRTTGTKIPNATSGGKITGLSNGATYSVVVTAYIENASGNDYIDSMALPAKPDTPSYIINGSGDSFTATKNGAGFYESTGTIQNVINAIRTDANGAACVIQFGDGATPLDIGAASASFDTSSGSWGTVELGGKITGSVSSTSGGTIIIANAVSLTSSADIANTAASNAYAVFHNGTGTVTISGGTVQATGQAATCRAVHNNTTGTVNISGGTVLATGTSGRAVYNNNTNGTVNISGGTVQASGTTGVAVYGGGRITVSGTALVTSVNTDNTTSGTIYTSSDTQLEITGGTVQNTADSNTGRTIFNSGGASTTITISGGMISATGGAAVYHNASGTVTITGGTVQTAAGTVFAVVNNSTGAINISGGTVQSSGLSVTSGGAVSNQGTGKITVSGTAKITSPSTAIGGGTIVIFNNGNATAERLVITGGTVENTAASSYTNNRTVRNVSTGAVTISGGTVSTTAGLAVYIESTGAVNISGGIVQATTGIAVYNASTSTITISQAAGAATLITSANTNAAGGTIILAAPTTDNTNTRLDMTGGTVQNTSASTGNAIRNNSTGEVSISGGTVQAPQNSTAYAIYNNSSGVVNTTGATIVGAKYGY